MLQNALLRSFFSLIILNSRQHVVSTFDKYNNDNDFMANRQNVVTSNHRELKIIDHYIKF